MPSHDVAWVHGCRAPRIRLSQEEQESSCDSDSDDDSWTAYSSSERSFSDSSFSDPPSTPGSVYLDLYNPCTNFQRPEFHSRPPSLYNEKLDTFYPLNTSLEPIDRERYAHSERINSSTNRICEPPFTPRHKPSRSWSSSTIAASEAPSSPLSVKRKRLDSLDSLPQPPEKKPRVRRCSVAPIPARPLLALPSPGSSVDVLPTATQNLRRSSIPKLAREKVRTFPPHVPLHPAFPLFYRQFPISSYFAPTDSLRKFVL